jgi:hypothetical protein
VAAFKQNLDRLAAHILQQNPYFNCGYALAWIDPKDGGVYGYKTAAKGDFERVVLFPADQRGDYFYLRPQGKAVYASSVETNLSDCVSGVMQTGTVRLVAIVDRADPHELIENLLHTLAGYGNAALSGGASDWNREIVTIDELQGREEKDIRAALTRLGSYTIVAVTFTLNTPIQHKGTGCRKSPVTPCAP